MYVAAAAIFVIDRKIKNLTSICITFSQHRNPRHQKKQKLESKSKVKYTSPSPQNLDSSLTQHWYGVSRGSILGPLLFSIGTSMILRTHLNS